MQPRRVLLGGAIVAVLAIVVASNVAWMPISSEMAPECDLPPVLTLEQDGLLFTYHVFSNTEGLFDLQRDPQCLRNLAEQRPADLGALRGLLCQEWGVPHLSDLSDQNDLEYQRLRGLGYL